MKESLTAQVFLTLEVVMESRLAHSMVPDSSLVPAFPLVCLKALGMKSAPDSLSERHLEAMTVPPKAQESLMSGDSTV